MVILLGSRDHHKGEEREREGREEGEKGRSSRGSGIEQAKIEPCRGNIEDRNTCFVLFCFLLLCF